MISALIYLRVTSIVNAYRARLRRLKQPRYLFGAIVGVAYFYFFFFRRFLGARFDSNNNPNAAFEFWHKAEPIAVVVLLLYLLSLWIFASDRAELTFSESEIAFLFPAPISRRGLIHFKLLAGQLRILVSAAFFALVRTRMGGGPLFFVIQLFGWWTILSCIGLHRIGAAFTRERLLDVGVNPLRRRLIAAALVVLIGGASYFWAKDQINDLLQSDTSHPLELLDTFLNTAPLSWVLWPLHLVVRPMFTNTIASFLHTFAPAIAVLVIQYFWVIKSEVAFEEASIAASRKRAEWIQAARSGRALQRGPKKRREEPFPLRPHGARSIAFFWRNLIALGPLAFPKWWIVGATLMIGATRWLIGHSEYDPFLTVMTVIVSILAG
ncbi:MAG TPA: putative ABC exporter domain-containing protein, partial [Opitutaceae bacterium]